MKKMRQYRVEGYTYLAPLLWSASRSDYWAAQDFGYELIKCSAHKKTHKSET